MRFEIVVELEGETYAYDITFDLPERFKELRVLEEKLTVNGKPVYTREVEQVHLTQADQDESAKFLIDSGVVALPKIQDLGTSNPLFGFKQWLARTLILRPIPSWIQGTSDNETLEPDTRGINFGNWFSGLLAYAPSAYSKIDDYLKQVMPDLKDIKNPVVGRRFRRLFVEFSNDQVSLNLPFEDLSDGEKCFMICALVLAANDAYGPLFCFWDEPDNYLAPSEVGHFVLALRKAFQTGGQFIATSHNPEAIRGFYDENTLLLYRKSHLEPTIVRRLDGLHVSGDLVDALIRGDVEP